MKKIIIIFLILALPVTVIAKEKKHIKTDDRECSECHVKEAQVWEDGKHGLMNVKCVVCHGSTDKNFVAKPDIFRCSGCHYEKVADVQKKLPPKVRQCSLCHALHSVKHKFHSEGGK